MARKWRLPGNGETRRRRGCKINTKTDRAGFCLPSRLGNLCELHARWIDDKFSALILDESCVFETLRENWIMQNSIDKTGYCTYLLSISISLHLIFSIHDSEKVRCFYKIDAQSYFNLVIIFVVSRPRWSHFPVCQSVLFRVRLCFSNLTTLTWKWPVQEILQKSIKRSLTWSWRADNSIPGVKCKKFRPLSACQLQVRYALFSDPQRAHVIRNCELRYKAFYFSVYRTETDKLIALCVAKLLSV